MMIYSMIVMVVVSLFLVTVCSSQSPECRDDPSCSTYPTAVCYQAWMKTNCKKLCSLCSDENTRGSVYETTTFTTTTTAAVTMYPPEITSHPEGPYSPGQTFALICKSKNPENARGSLMWNISRDGIETKMAKVADDTIQLDIFRISAKHDGLQVTCLEKSSNWETQDSITIKVNTSLALGEWEMWSTCSATCGEGSRTRRRTCTSTEATCPRETTETVACQTSCCVPKDGRWSAWSYWSSCSQHCGNGTRTRSRTCTQPNDCGRPCEGDRSQEEACQVQTCARCTNSLRDCHRYKHRCSESWVKRDCKKMCSMCLDEEKEQTGKETTTVTTSTTAAKKPNVPSLTIDKRGNNVSFTCSLPSGPVQTFELFKITTNGTQTSRWRIDNVKCDDAGMYFCRARYGKTQANSTSKQLNIQCPPESIDGRLTTPERIEISEGSGQFTFQLIAHPVPTIENIKYYKEDSVSSLKEEPVRSGFITGKCEQNTPDLHVVTCKLFITDAVPQDNGLYSAKVKNSNGNLNVTFELNVIAQDFVTTSTTAATAQSTSLFWIGLVIVPILILIGVLVFFVIRQRAGGQTQQDTECDSQGGRSLVQGTGLNPAPP